MLHCCCHLVSYFITVLCDYAAAKRMFDTAVRCICGTEAAHISLLYFLTHVSAAGGMDPMLSSRENFGGHELTVVVWFVSGKLSI